MQRKRIFSVSEKNYNAKRNANPTLVYPGLRYAHKKLSFACKNIFWEIDFFCVQKSICG